MIKHPMLPLRSVVLALFSILPLAGVIGAQPADDLQIGLEEVAASFDEPVDIAFPDDGSGRLFVVEKKGLIRVADGGGVRPSPFLDLRDRVSTEGEQGLLGLAFHPRYRDNGLFFVNYTNQDGHTRVVRYRASGDPDVADPSSALVILAVPQFATSHNGGDLVFGPVDGMLYISIGDGGGAGDPRGNGQNRATLLGTIVRIDIDRASAAEPYRIPADNPFLGDPSARGEIWVYGLRNPWRFSADRVTGDLFIGDVGQNRFEEIDFQAAGSGGGENYGWRLMEADACFPAGSTCDPSGLTPPILSYGRSVGRSVTGGFRYRGQAFPALHGVYLYADFAELRLFGATRHAQGWRSRQLLRTTFLLSAFGEDPRGELYVADFSGGRVLRVVAVGGDPNVCPWPNGHPRFCRDCGPCENAQGDCDSDAECTPGNVCMDNVGADFGFSPGIDVCTTAPFGCPWPLGHGRFCRDCGICDAGEGDCDSDAECRTGTTCVDNVGAQFGFAPGVDVCVAGPPPSPPATCPLPPGHPDFCRDCGPCASGQGDCDNDSQCAAGLRCVDDIGPQFGFGMRVDVCGVP